MCALADWGLAVVASDELFNVSLYWHALRAAQTNRLKANFIIVIIQMLRMDCIVYAG